MILARYDATSPATPATPLPIENEANLAWVALPYWKQCSTVCPVFCPKTKYPVELPLGLASEKQRETVMVFPCGTINEVVAAPEASSNTQPVTVDEPAILLMYFGEPVFIHRK